MEKHKTSAIWIFACNLTVKNSESYRQQQGVLCSGSPSIGVRRLLSLSLSVSSPASLRSSFLCLFVSYNDVGVQAWDIAVPGGEKKHNVVLLERGNGPFSHRTETKWFFSTILILLLDLDSIPIGA